jgi:hypothetical protein
MIARDVMHFGSFTGHLKQASNNFQMLFWKIGLPKVPNVNDVSIEHDDFWFYGFEVGIELFCMAAIGSQVNITEHTHI